MGLDARILFLVPEPLPNLQQIRNRLAEAFGPDRVGVDRKDGRHCITEAEDYEREMVSDPGTLYSIGYWGRYYGIHYERGNIVQILAICRWLKEATGGKVYYGNDCSDSVEEMTEEYREELWRHFVANGGRPYRMHLPFFGADKPPMHCSFCDADMSCSGGGGSIEFWVCLSCDWKVERDNKTSVVKERP